MSNTTISAEELADRLADADSDDHAACEVNYILTIAERNLIVARLRNPIRAAPDTISALADRIAKLPSYDGDWLGCSLYRVDQDQRIATRKRQVILIDASSRDLIVAALRNPIRAAPDTISVAAIRKWQRHHLLRQFGDNGLVLPENLELSEHIDEVLANRAVTAPSEREIQEAARCIVDRSREGRLGVKQDQIDYNCDHSRTVCIREATNEIRALLNRKSHAGEGPVPSTLAADRTTSPSESRRGEPAPYSPGKDKDVTVSKLPIEAEIERAILSNIFPRPDQVESGAARAARAILKLFPSG